MIEGLFNNKNKKDWRIEKIITIMEINNFINVVLINGDEDILINLKFLWSFKNFNPLASVVNFILKFFLINYLLSQ